MRNTVVDLNATIASSGLLQQVNQSSPCRVSSRSSLDKTTPYAQENVLDTSKSEPIEMSVLKTENDFTLEGTFY